MTCVTHEIVEQDGIKVGTDGAIRVTALDPEAKMFKRRAVKAVGTPDASEECWLVTELNGVHVYQSGSDIVVTTRNLYP